MIKGITVLRTAPSAAAYDTLASFFAALGFAPGRGWSDPRASHHQAASGDPSAHPSDHPSGGQSPHQSHDHLRGTPARGVSFLAPLGNLEFADGPPPSTAEILIEVTALDSVYRVAQRWMQQNLGERDAAGRLGEIADTHWRSRLFTVEPVPAMRFAFWEWQDVLQGRPIALEGDLSAAGMRFTLVVSRWNAVITDRLLQGALDALLRSGASRAHLQIIRVPGAWEIPAAARQAAQSGNTDAIITLGLLLRGETAHYEAIYNEVARGLGQSQQETGIPHAFGVLTCDTLEQALNRAGIKAGNKGFDAAIAAIEMVSLQHKLAAAQPPAQPAASVSGSGPGSVSESGPGARS